MKNLILILFLLALTPALAQDTKTTETNSETVKTNTDVLEEPTAYVFEDQEFNFVPDELGFHVKKVEDGKEIDYGTLRRTTDDGYYVFTSTVNENVSYGRFDEAGNFNALRYDEKADTVLEEKFMIAQKGN